ncbi:hypothetical protein ACFL4G_03410 [Thermodesulfobacteriota bacterium]
MSRSRFIRILALVLALPLLNAAQCPNQQFRVDNGRVWSFDAGDPDNGLWTAVHSIANLHVEEGKLVGDITGEDPHLVGPTDLRALASLNSGVRIRMKIDAGSQAQLYWTTSTAPAWSSAMMRTFSITADNAWHTYTLAFERSRAWTGFITGLRIDPNTSGSGHFEIDTVEFVGASLSSNNIQYYGYYHVEDDRFGHYMSETAPYTNFVHLTWGALADFRGTVVEAAALGLKVVPELSSVFLFQPEDQWPVQLGAFAAAVSGLEETLLCAYLVDEPYIHTPPMDRAKQERAIALVQSVFPGLPTMINYTGHAGLNEPASNLDWIAFDAYDFDDVVQYHPFYTGYGKPTFMIGKSYSNDPVTQLKEIELLALERLSYSQVLKYDEVVALWWFMYADVVDQEMSGARSYPALLEYQQEISAELF